MYNLNLKNMTQKAILTNSYNYSDYMSDFCCKINNINNYSKLNIMIVYQ